MLLRQVFNQPGPKDQNDHRHYLRGDATKGCAVYADTPHVRFGHGQPTALDPTPEDRVFVSLKTHAKLGFGKSCFGLAVTFDSEVSFIPQAKANRSASATRASSTSRPTRKSTPCSSLSWPEKCRSR